MVGAFSKHKGGKGDYPSNSTPSQAERAPFPSWMDEKYKLSDLKKNNASLILSSSLG